MQPQSAACPFNPINHVLNPEVLTQHECMICMSRSMSLLRCRTCKQYLCNQCVIDIRTTQKRCPQWCTPQGEFEVELVPGLAYKFGCPFSASCTQVLASIHEFVEHDRHCQYITPQQQAEQALKWSFKCKQGHPLEIKIDVYANLIERKECQQCHECTLTRAICRRCPSEYCRYCRPLPIVDMRCPIGHEFVRRDVRSNEYRCDICELAPVILGLEIYDDFKCNFGICEKCMNEMPEFKEQVHYRENLHNYCDLVGDHDFRTKNGMIGIQQHGLHVIKQQRQEKCQWCGKNKQCYKTCHKCQKYYCFECKIFEVRSDRSCEFEHQLVDTSTIIKSVQQAQTTKVPERCLKCALPVNKLQLPLQDRYYYDKDCNVILCLQCIRHLIVYKIDALEKQSSLNMSPCSFGSHPLFILPYDRDFQSACSLCGKIRTIKLICAMCEQAKLYCAECKPPPCQGNCYCGKLLRKGASDALRGGHCLKCDAGIESGAGWGCRPCGYGVCQKCYHQPSNPK